MTTNGKQKEKEDRKMKRERGKNRGGKHKIPSYMTDDERTSMTSREKESENTQSLAGKHDNITHKYCVIQHITTQQAESQIGTLEKEAVEH